MPEIDFVGPSAADEEKRPQGTARLVNLFPETAERSPTVLRGVPGLTRATTLTGTFCRVLKAIGEELHAVQGGAVKRITATGDAVTLMTLPDNVNTTLHGLEGYLIATAGTLYKVRSPAGVETAPTGAFSAVSSAVVMARRAVMTEADGRRIQWSDVGAPETINGLSFATAEKTDETLIRCFVVGPELWLFKASTTERWYPSGSGFLPIAGGDLPVGLRGFRLICDFAGGALMVGSDNRVYRAVGGGLEVISTTMVEKAIAGATPLLCLSYRIEGHEFGCIVFSDRPALCVDFANGLWHERASGADLDPWTIRAAAECYGRRYAADDLAGLFTFEALPVDDGEPVHRVWTGITIQLERKRFRLMALEMQAHVGRGSVTPLRDRPPMVRLRVSEDFGMTWTERASRSLGEEGQYSTRLLWRAMGQFRAFTPEMRCAEPLDYTFDGTAFAEVA